MKRIFVFVALTLWIADASAQREKIVAAYVYQFTRFLDWCPEGKSGDFTIAVLGDSPVTKELQAIANNKKIGNQSIIVRSIASMNEIGKTNILFLPSGKSSQLGNINGQIGSRCTLVIVDKAGTASNGACISFVEVDGKMQFEINKPAITSRSIQINSELTKLAKNVYL
jgi:hypothetical protein